MKEVKIARSLDTVHTHTHTHKTFTELVDSLESYSLVNKDIKIKKDGLFKK